MIYRNGIVAQKDPSLPTVLIPGDGTTVWYNTIGAITTSLGQVVPSSTVNGWDKGSSFGTVPASTDFELEFRAVYMAGESSDGNAIIGVSDVSIDHTVANVDFGIYVRDTNVYVFENGSNLITTSAWVVGELFKIKRVGTTITYYRGTGLFYTSLTSSSSQIVFDNTLLRKLGAKDIKITY